MADRWRLGNRSKPKGQLADAKEFMPNNDNLRSLGVRVPINISDKESKDRASQSAHGLASPAIRSFEIQWDKSKKELDIVITASKDDIVPFQQIFTDMYPGVEFYEKDVVPEWFDDTNEKYKFFDTGVYHGHYFAVFNKTKALQLMTHIANNIQLAEHAWIQFVFRTNSFSKHFQLVGRKLDKRWQQVNSKEYVSDTDALFSLNPKPKEHPDKGFDFSNHYKELRAHVKEKGQGSHVMMSIRGLVEHDEELELDFNLIESVPIEQVSANWEYVTKNEYGVSKFIKDSRPLKEKKFALRKQKVEENQIKITGIKKQKFNRIEIFPKRLLPQPHGFLANAVAEYFEPSWLGMGKYRERKSPPFLMLILSEMPLVIHLPDPTVRNIQITRGATIPTKLTPKRGFVLGFIKK